MSDIRKEIVLECSGRKFVLDKPLMKHNRAVEKIMVFFGERKNELGGITNKLQKAGIKIEEEINIPDGLLTEEELQKIERINSSGNIMIILSDILYAIIREAPWESDFRKLNIMSIEENVEMDEGLELLEHCMKILEHVIVKGEKKTAD